MFEAHVIFSPSNTKGSLNMITEWFEAHVIFSPSNTINAKTVENISFEAHVIFSPSNTKFDNKKSKLDV